MTQLGIGVDHLLKPELLIHENEMLIAVAGSDMFGYFVHELLRVLTLQNLRLEGTVLTDSTDYSFCQSVAIEHAVILTVTFFSLSVGLFF